MMIRVWREHSEVMWRNLPSLTIQVPLWSHTHTTWAGTKVPPQLYPHIHTVRQGFLDCLNPGFPRFLIPKIIQSWCNNKITAWARYLQGECLNKGNSGFFYPYSLNAKMSGLLGPCPGFGCWSPGWTLVPVPFAVPRVSSQPFALAPTTQRSISSWPCSLQTKLPSANAFLNNRAGTVKEIPFPCIHWEENGLYVLESFFLRVSLESLFQAEISRK